MEAIKKPERGITVMLPDDLWTQLKQRALDERTTTKQIIISLLLNAFSKGGRK